jgi:hypothetical protein
VWGRQLEVRELVPVQVLEERVRLDLLLPALVLRPESLLGIAFQKLRAIMECKTETETNRGDGIGGLVRKATRNNDVLIANEMNNIIKIIAAERVLCDDVTHLTKKLPTYPSDKHLKQNDTERPEVGRCSVWQSVVHLGRHVVGRATDRECIL